MWPRRRHPRCPRQSTTRFARASRPRCARQTCTDTVCDITDSHLTQQAILRPHMYTTVPWSLTCTPLRRRDVLGRNQRVRVQAGNHQDCEPGTAEQRRCASSTRRWWSSRLSVMDLLPACTASWGSVNLLHCVTYAQLCLLTATKSLLLRLLAVILGRPFDLPALRGDEPYTLVLALIAAAWRF